MFMRIRLLKEIANKALFYVEQHANEYVDWYVKKYGKEPPDVVRKEKKSSDNFVKLNSENNTSSVVLNNIIEVMTNKNISQRELCTSLGLPESQFSNWKRGNNKSYLKYVSQIAEILEVSIASLYGEIHETQV